MSSLSETAKGRVARFASSVVVTPSMRRRAAALCALMASSDGSSDFEPACEAIGVGCFKHDGAAELARVALWSAEYDADTRALWAEAEAMLRDGWSPE